MEERRIEKNSLLLLVGMQHLLAMFGATILVPILTGFPVSVALFTSGLGTLVFHYITDNEVPAYLGSSFAFIAPLSLVIASYGGVSSALGGIIVAGFVYLLVAWFVKSLGLEVVRKLFPPVVTGPVIIIIGLSLAPIAIGQIGSSFSGVFVALATLISAIVVVLYTKGFMKIVPVLVGLVVGYVLSLVLGLVDTSLIADSSWIGLPSFVFPTFNASAILIIAPVAIVSIIEHIGDMLAISETIGKTDPDLLEKPGLHRTLAGDGVATVIAGFLGGPANTTYGENIGVLALTRVFDPLVMKIGAVFAILISFVPKVEGLILSIPDPVIGGISILLFGMITAIGIRTLVKAGTDLQKSRNLVIVSVVLVIGLGGATVSFGSIELSSMALAGLIGVLMSYFLPEELS